MYPQKVNVTIKLLSGVLLFAKLISVTVLFPVNSIIPEFILKDQGNCELPIG